MSKADKLWTDALRAELAAAGPDSKALRRIAKVVIAKAGAGDMLAIKEIADRLEGKPVQAIDANVNEVRSFVIAPDTASKEEWALECEAMRNGQPSIFGNGKVQ